MVNHHLPLEKRGENFKKMEQVSFEEKKKTIVFYLKNKSYSMVPDIVGAQYLNKLKTKVFSLFPTVLVILDII